ncbi:site-specific integrase [Chitinimonas naiadis]
MSIKKRPDGKWAVNVQPGGRTGPQFKRIFDTQAEAKQFVVYVQSKHAEDPEWKPAAKDKRRLSDLVNSWYEAHGRALRSGTSRFGKLKAMCEAMGDPLAANFTAEDFADFRAQRLEAGVSMNTVNHDHAYLRAVFQELVRLGQWSKPNPLKTVRAYRIVERELSFLTREQIDVLLAGVEQSANPHVKVITKVCLATGARWGEAERLTTNQVRHGVIQFAMTKSGKTRAVPIQKELERELNAHHKAHGEGNRLFGPSYNTFCDLLDATEIVLPKGQATHVLRHTFASHFMMNGGNILVLQKVLGHSTLTMTMKYAHLAPDHLQEAKLLNPLYFQISASEERRKPE